MTFSPISSPQSSSPIDSSASSSPPDSPPPALSLMEKREIVDAFVDAIFRSTANVENPELRLIFIEKAINKYYNRNIDSSFSDTTLAGRVQLVRDIPDYSYSYLLLNAFKKRAAEYPDAYISALCAFIRDRKSAEAGSSESLHWIEPAIACFRHLPRTLPSVTAQKRIYALVSEILGKYSTQLNASEEKNKPVTVEQIIAKELSALQKKFATNQPLNPS